MCEQRCAEVRQGKVRQGKQGERCRRCESKRQRKYKERYKLDYPMIKLLFLQLVFRWCSHNNRLLLLLLFRRPFAHPEHCQRCDFSSRNWNWDWALTVEWMGKWLSTCEAAHEKRPVPNSATNDLLTAQKLWIWKRYRFAGDDMPSVTDSLCALWEI